MVDAEGGASILTDSPWYIFDDFITSEYSNALINRYAPDFHRITKRWSGSEISRSRSKLIPTFSGPFLEERQSTQQIWNDSMFIVDIDIIDWAASRRVDFYSSGSKLAIWLIRQARPFWFNHYRSHWHLGVIDLLLLRQSHLFPTSILGLFIVLIIVCGLNSVSDQYKRWKWLAWSIHPCTHTHRWHVDKYHNRMLPAIFHGDPSNQSIFFQKHVWLMCVHHLESLQDLNSRPCYFQWSTGNLVIYDMIS